MIEDQLRLYNFPGGKELRTLRRQTGGFVEAVKRLFEALLILEFHALLEGAFCLLEVFL